MHPFPALLACVIIPTAQAFQFNGPTVTEKPDLGKAITVSWDATGGSLCEPDARALNLWFRAFLGGSNNDRAGWNIAANLSLVRSNSYKWDPSNVSRLLQHNNQTLSLNTVHTFEARLFDQEGERLATVDSDEYALNGPESIIDLESGDGARTRVHTATAPVVAIAAMGILMVL